MDRHLFYTDSRSFHVLVLCIRVLRFCGMRKLGLEAARIGTDTTSFTRITYR